MNVQFTTLSKKLNSTKQGSGGSSFSCRLKKGSSKTNPFIEVSAGDPSSYNYAYIPTYNRYYYVDNWTFDGGLWAADLAVDVLASYKEAIGAANLYILRSSAEYDEKILDTLYPAKMGGVNAHNLLTNPWTIDYAAGSYVVGVVSKAAANGAVAYYVLSYSDMATLRGFMMSGNNLPLWTDNWDALYPTLTGEMVKALINPFQYIASCVWLPFQMYSGGAAAMDFGYWESGLSFPTLSANSWYNAQQCAIPNNFAGTEEEWRRQAPFAKYQICAPPFGTIDLDASIACDDELNLITHVDPITGMGRLEVYGMRSNTIYADVKAQIGVPVQLAQLSTDILGAATTYANAAGGVVTNALMGNISGAISSAINGIGDTARAAMPTLSVGGGSGGPGMLAGRWELLAFFRNIVDRAPAILGRPLCKYATPASLAGYMVVQNGDAVDCQGTREEKEQIQSYLEGGFYYE